ncbi:unnamed protein product [Blepharisma stoltei]|uniref:Chitin-binding type-2 domain-containing protein n=1 Tax=Blepharisma stoltei TaxID=1481888 RepID=A0AAU9JAF0_9CILI|nr:unnamed protein product [Blepharisma stoltei]
MKLGYAVLIVGALASECKPPTDCSTYCRVQYNGKKNYYNLTDGDCYEVLKCSYGEFLDISSNKCILASQDFPEIERASTSSSSNNETVVEDKPIICDHGTFKNSQCVCDEGYTTSASQNASDYYVHQCNVLSSSSSGDDGYSTGNNGELYLSQQADDTINNIPLTFVEKLAILAGISFTFCISTFIIRKKLRRKYL